jgi:putative ATP-grasp target RiPP
MTTPWALDHLTPLPPADQTPVYSVVRLNPDSQQAVYLDPAGRPIEAGKHGTNKETSKSLPTGGGDDGSKPQSSDDTVQTDYSDD